MAYWIFKIADQDLYPNVIGERHVFDNTHSVRVVPDDVFIYLDKRRGYSFTATGVVRKLTDRLPTQSKSQRTQKVRKIFTAHLADLVWFSRPLSIASQTAEGRRNRARLGILDVNRLGWSRSIPALGESMYHAILDLADAEHLLPSSTKPDDYSVPDTWAKARIRSAIRGFTDVVLRRSDSTCVVCGTTVSVLVDAAHLSPFACDKENRGNPANGVCLCTYCHRALDRRLIAIEPSGKLLVSPLIEDEVALHHFSQVSTAQRTQWLTGVDRRFLAMTVQWFEDCLNDSHTRKVSETSK